MSALKRPEPRPGVMAIDAYVPGKSSAPGVAKVFKLSSNETPLGPSRKAIDAYMAEAERLHEYPDGASTELREAIGRPGPTMVSHQPGLPVTGCTLATCWSPVSAWQMSTALARFASSVP